MVPSLAVTQVRASLDGRQVPLTMPVPLAPVRLDAEQQRPRLSRKSTFDQGASRSTRRAGGAERMMLSGAASDQIGILSRGRAHTEKRSGTLGGAARWTAAIKWGGDAEAARWRGIRRAST